MLFGLITSTGEVEAAKAQMNANYGIVVALAGRSPSVPETLGNRVLALKAEVEWVNAQSTFSGTGTFPGGGPGFAAIIERANAATNTGNQIAGELAALVGEANPTKSSGSSLNTILTLAVVGFGAYWLYKWATKEESYPRHLAPRYAGGSRRL